MKIIVKSVQLLLVIMAFFSIFCEVNPRENIEQVNPLPIPSVQIESRLIVPGNGTNLIHLQMSRQELVALLGKPNEEYEHNGYCSYSEMHWFPKANSDGSVEGDGVFVFLRDHKVFEIRFNKGYFTNQGITFGSSLKELQSKTSVLLYQLTKSANTSTNNEDLQFLIEKESGIAYEIGKDYKSRIKVVNAIYVFHENSDFLPWGCISENQSLAESSSLN